MSSKDPREGLMDAHGITLIPVDPDDLMTAVKAELVKFENSIVVSDPVHTLTLIHDCLCYWLQDRALKDQPDTEETRRLDS